MKLRETYIDLTGTFKSTIENNLILCDGVSTDSEPPHDIADLYAFHVVDNELNIKETIAVIFRQVEDKVEFRYRKFIFKLISVSLQSIVIMDKDGRKFFIDRTTII